MRGKTAFGQCCPPPPSQRRPFSAGRCAHQHGARLHACSTLATHETLLGYGLVSGHQAQECSHLFRAITMSVTVGPTSSGRTVAFSRLSTLCHAVVLRRATSAKLSSEQARNSCHSQQFTNEQVWARRTNCAEPCIGDSKRWHMSPTNRMCARTHEARTQGP